MINRVCRRLMQEHQEVPVVTIHDSILTTRKNVTLVRKIIEEEFLRVGLQPTLHEEEYAKEPPPVPRPLAKKRARRAPPASHGRATDFGASDAACAQQSLCEGQSEGKENPARPWSASSSAEPPGLSNQGCS